MSVAGIARRFSPWQAFLRSFHYADVFRDAAFAGRGIGLRYLYFVCLIALMPTFVYFHFEYSTFIERELETIVGQLPVMEIRGGLLHTPEERSYHVTDSQGRLLAVIDTSSKPGTPTGASEDALIYANKNRLEFRSETDVLSSHEMEDIPDTVIDREKASSMLEYGAFFMWMFFPVFAALAALGQLIRLLFVGALGFLVCSLMRVELSITQLLRMTMLAAGPAIFFEGMAILLGVQVPLMGVLWITLILFYLYSGILAVKPYLPPPSRNDDAPW